MNLRETVEFVKSIEMTNPNLDPNIKGRLKRERESNLKALGVKDTKSSTVSEKIENVESGKADSRKLQRKML